MVALRQPCASPVRAVRTHVTLRPLPFLVLMSFSFLLTGCTDEDENARTDTDEPKSQTVASRWYTADNVSRGDPIYAQHCAACHGKGGQGTFTWRKPDADGKYPPPPLNGTGHAWHHPIRALGSQIKFGAPGGSGKMPGLAQTLSDEDVIDVIAWFQDKWSDEIYTAWLARELQSRSEKQ
jgi:mono/diheme cytochrome c family protein